MKYYNLCGFLHTSKHLQLVFVVFVRAISVGNSYFGEGSELVLQYINCVGPELNVAQCSWGSVGQLNCHHGRDVGVICQGIFEVSSANSYQLPILSTSETLDITDS